MHFGDRKQKTCADMLSVAAQSKGHRAFVSLMNNSRFPLRSLGDPVSDSRVVISSAPIQKGNLVWEFFIPNRALN